MCMSCYLLRRRDRVWKPLGTPLGTSLNAQMVHAGALGILEEIISN